jgi:hypothetical protein
MLGPAASGEICHGPAARCIMQQQSNNEPCNAIILAPPYVAPTSTAPSELFSSVRLPMPEATNVGVRTKEQCLGIPLLVVLPMPLLLLLLFVLLAFHPFCPIPAWSRRSSQLPEAPVDM